MADSTKDDAKRTKILRHSVSLFPAIALLYKECGLKGLSGISNDVRELLESGDARAKMAIDSFTLGCARAVADLATVMGGIDGLVR